MPNTSKHEQPSRRDVAYYRQRQKNRVFTDLVAFFADEAERTGITKKELSDLIGKDPAQITRWFSAPSNFELDTLSDVLLALGAEMDHRIVRFSDRSPSNYIHPLVQTVSVQIPEQIAKKPDLNKIEVKPALSAASSSTASVAIR
ncbi:MAG TPA: helix-turn-helix transcriptional regulator [Bradyrhizobium sp.]|nr:helix-turn-helix transcriptional regulator [Bradyrhizobium sp.]